VHPRQRAHTQAGGAPRLTEQPSGRVAGEPAGEDAAAVAPRVELADGDHLVVDPPRSQRLLHQLLHPFL
jgi:hypothetical protein